MGFIPAGIEGSPHYVGDKHSGRLRGMVFVGAPVGDDEWVAEEPRGLAPQAAWWYACGRRGAEEAGKAWR